MSMRPERPALKDTWGRCNLPRLIPKPMLLRALIIGSAAAILAVFFNISGIFSRGELVSYDICARMLASQRQAENGVVLVLVDEKSLQWAQKTQEQGWPWPRQYYAAIADFARRAGAASLTFDVIYSDPSSFGVSDDRMFARALKEQGGTVLAAFYGRKTGSFQAFPDYIPLRRAAVPMENVDSSLFPAFSRASFPIPALTRSAARLGNVNISPDADGVYRRAPLAVQFDDRRVPSLSLAAYLAAKKNARLSLDTVDRCLWLDGRKVPLDGSGNLIVRFDKSSRKRRCFSAAAIIQSEIRLARNSENRPPVDPSALEGRHVMVGFSAVGLYDLHPLPVDSTAPGVEFHAVMLENLLAGNFMRTPTPAGELLYVALFAFFAGLATSLAKRTLATSAAFAGVFVLPFGIGLLAHSAGLWLPVVVPGAAGLIGAAAAAVVNYATEGRERRFIKRAFRQYLAPAVIERLISDPDRLKLGGERRELTVFFSDLEGFTSLSEGLSPEALTHLLNEYLTAMTDILTETGATIDKYEGDAIVAFWNAPLEVPGHARVAVEAALACQKKLAALRPAFRQLAGRDLFMRIGVNTGEAVVGNMGSRSRFDYTVLGDTVNLASRLEGSNKQFGTWIMISEATARRLPETIACREIGRITVLGRTRPVRVYEPMDRRVYGADQERYETFARALALYYQGEFMAARRAFLNIPGDPPAGRYAEKCAKLAQSPPANWDGVWTLDSK